MLQLFCKAMLECGRSLDLRQLEVLATGPLDSEAGLFLDTRSSLLSHPVNSRSVFLESFLLACFHVLSEGV